MFKLSIVLVISFLCANLVTAVGSETIYNYVDQDIVRQCANNTINVSRRKFCNFMGKCILSKVDEKVKANMSAGSAMMGLLPTAIWLIANNIEDVLSVARRDLFFGFLMGVASGGASGLPRSGRPSEVDAGSWFVDIDMPLHSANAIVLPALMNAPGDSQNKLRMIRRELQLIKMKFSMDQNTRTNSATRHFYWVLGWLLRFSSLAATSGVIWLFIVRQDTSYVAWNCPKTQWSVILLNILPPFFEYLATSLIEYREYWTIEGQNLVCYTYGTPPDSARGVLRGQWQDRKKQLSFWENAMPQLISSPTVIGNVRPFYVLIWKRMGLLAQVSRMLLLLTRGFVFLWGTIVLSSLVLVTAAQATMWFTVTVGLQFYNSLVLILLDAIPGATAPIEEVTIR